MHTWHEEPMALSKTFTFPTFPAAIAFVRKVADSAEELQHHPKIEIDYTRVTLTLSTHDQGGIVTDKDHELARRIDMLQND